MGSQSSTQIVRLGSKGLYSLSHLTGPTYDLLCVGVCMHVGMSMCVNICVSQCKGQMLMSGIIPYNSLPYFGDRAS